MKYTIKEILPGQIRVEYEDNSWAIVPIPANPIVDSTVIAEDPTEIFSRHFVFDVIVKLP